MKKACVFLIVAVLMSNLCLTGCGVNSQADQTDNSDNSAIHTEDTAEPAADGDAAVDDGSTVDEQENNTDQAAAAGEDKQKSAEKDSSSSSEKTSRDQNTSKNSQSGNAAKKEETRKDDSKKEDTVTPLPWPDNEYTKILPRPNSGLLTKTGIQDGIYCLLFTGVTISDAKAYAATLITWGYSNDVSETVASGTYVFGGGTASGAFAVVNYQNNQMMIGVQP